MHWRPTPLNKFTIYHKFLLKETLGTHAIAFAASETEAKEWLHSFNYYLYCVRHSVDRQLKRIEHEHVFQIKFIKCSNGNIDIFVTKTPCDNVKKRFSKILNHLKGKNYEKR